MFAEVTTADRRAGLPESFEGARYRYLVDDCEYWTSLPRTGNLAAWDVPASAGFEQFTAFLALNADRYADQEISALGERLRAAGLVYLCAWGPECGRVHLLFDLVFTAEEQVGTQRSLLMTTDHEDEPLAEGLWYAIDYAIGADVKDLPRSAVVIGTDRHDWRREIRSWLGDVEELRRHVVEDLPG